MSENNDETGPSRPESEESFVQDITDRVLQEMEAMENIEDVFVDKTLDDITEHVAKLMAIGVAKKLREDPAVLVNNIVERKKSGTDHFFIRTKSGVAYATSDVCGRCYVYVWTCGKGQLVSIPG